MTGTRYELRSEPSGDLEVVRRPGVLAEQDPFRYGHRWVAGPRGYEMVPLTYEDLLDPQEGDFVTDDNLNRKLAGYFQHFLEKRFEDEKDVAVWSDFKLRFGKSGKGPGPDVCVVRGVRDRDRRRGSFWFGHEPGELVLVIEIVSRQYKNKDYKDSKQICEERGVPELILIELLGEYLSGPYKLSGYRLDASGAYREIEPDEKNGLVSEQTDLRIRPDLEGWGLEVVDLRTGERLLRPEEESKRAEEEAARAEEEAARAEEEAARAERAERRAESEALARREVEREAARALAENLVAILENRGLHVGAAARRRILDCRDLQELRHWARRAFAATTVDELWQTP